MKLKVFLFGETGRMGQELTQLIKNSDVFEYVGGFSRAKNDVQLKVNPDIVIDFSLPETQEKLLQLMTNHPCALVSGTTGLNPTQKENLKALGKNSPIFWAANMSFGVYLLCQLTEKLARYKKFYDYRIEETHHIHKKDRPSGTALIVASAAEKSLGQIPEIISHREEEVFGIHHFIAESKNEKLTLSHEAFNRTLFAQGALDVSQWLITQPKGFYTMDDFFKSI